MQTPIENTLIQFESPVTAIQALHTSPIGVITIHRKTPDWENLYAIRTEDMPAIFQELQEQLNLDSYFSINTMSESPERSKIRPDLPAAIRNENAALSRLNACYTDLDVYHAGITVGAAIGYVIDAQAEGLIPAPSIIVRSGRGVWLHWLLRDETGERPRAWKATKDWYKEIQRGIQKQFEDLGADPNSVDPARVMRVPQSTNTKADKQVSFWFQEKADGQRPEYTMDELTRFFCPEREAKPTKKPKRNFRGIQESIDTVRDTLKAGSTNAGSRRRWENCAWNIEQLSRIRRGFIQGKREQALWIYANALRGLGASFDEARNRLKRMSLDCRPAFPLNEMMTLLFQVFKPEYKVHRFKNTTIAFKLQVTPAESCRLKSIPAAGQKPLPKPPSKKTRRRELIQRIIEKRDAEKMPPLSIRGMKKELTKYGVHVTHKIVWSDLRSLK